MEYIIAKLPCRYTKTPEDTVAAALKGGTDLNCGGFYQKNGQVGRYGFNKLSVLSAESTIIIIHLQDAYDKKKITDDDLNLAMGRLFAFR